MNFPITAIDMLKTLKRQSLKWTSTMFNRERMNSDMQTRKNSIIQQLEQRNREQSQQRNTNQKLKTNLAWIPERRQRKCAENISGIGHTSHSFPPTSGELRKAEPHHAVEKRNQILLRAAGKTTR